MKNILKLSLLLISTFGISCSSDDDSSSSSISDSVLTGTVFGENFTAEGGQAFDTSFGDEELVSINITNIIAGCESSIFDYDLSVSTSVPFEEGTYEDSNVVFRQEGETPLNVLSSTVIIEEITEETITVSIDANSSDSDVEGVFTVDYCE